MRVLMTASLIAGSLSLAACSSDNSGVIVDEDGNEVNYSIDEDTGETAVTVETQEGTATMISGDDVPIDLPAGFTIYPGAEVVSNTVVSHGEGQGTVVYMETDASPEDLAEFYKTQANDAGVEIQMDMTAENTKMLAGETEEGMVFSLNATRQGDTTSAQIMVGDQMGR